MVGAAFATLAAILSGHGALAFAPTPGRAPPRVTQLPRRQSPSSSSSSLRLGDFFNNLGGKQPRKEADEAAAAVARRADVGGKKTVAAAADDDKGGYYDEDDPIEKIFGFFFGKKEEAPLGMARFGQNRFPEQYPATVDEWAAPVEGDDAEMSILRPLLKNTNLESRGLRLTYDANRDGWDPTTFHSRVDRQGGAVVLCTTKSGLMCGGYNPKGWVGYGEARGSIAAFLFVLGGGYADSNTGAPGIKLRKVGGPGLAQMDMPETGPQFSPDALVIRLDNNKDPRLARSKLGSYYERLPDGTNSLFGRESAVQLKELKVYHGVYAEGEYVPFTDADPFALN